MIIFFFLLKNFLVGIDLGNTYSCVGIWKNDRVEIISNDYGNRTTPSYVAFTDKEILIGDAAKNQVSINPHNTVFDIIRLIGHDINDFDLHMMVYCKSILNLFSINNAISNILM